MNQVPDILSLNFPSYCNLCSMETTGCPAKMSKTAKHKMKQFGMHGYIISLGHFHRRAEGPASDREFSWWTSFFSLLELHSCTFSRLITQDEECTLYPKQTAPDMLIEIPSAFSFPAGCFVCSRGIISLLRRAKLKKHESTCIDFSTDHYKGNDLLKWTKRILYVVRAACSIEYFFSILSQLS